MQLPDEAPKLPKLPFLIGDGLLLVTAVLIAQRSDSPLSGTALLAIVACVAVGAALAAVPYLVDYARRQDAALLDRQNSLEALARTTAASAEQIGIAASGLHEIAELVQRNLKHAEQLPQKLQEKINEFGRQRDEAIVAENEALTQEVNSLRASEAEKLEAAATRVHRTVGELAKWEQTLQSQIQAAREFVERLPVATDEAGQRARVAITAASDDAVARMLGEIDAHLAAALGMLTARASQSTPTEPSRAKEKSTRPAPTDPQAAEPVSTLPNADPDNRASTPSTPSTPPPPPEPLPERAAPQTTVTTSEAADVQAADVTNIESPAPERPPTASGKNARKRPRKPADSGQGTLLDLGPTDDENGGTPATGVTDRALSNDGLTRLVVTAYIGIGNRLFVRGEGPGLTWEKGVPLQFISIGKWRWETADATAPVSLKVFKNDQVECPALGTVTVEPGQQTEVNANF